MGEISTTTLIGFVFLLGAAFVAMFIAGSNGRGKMLWFTLGLILGPVAVAIVYRLGPAEYIRSPAKRTHENMDRLSTLKNLRDRGEISQAEYDEALTSFMVKNN
ncbi:MAG: SHOCT domain-containing protein [Sphingomonadales bacterium]|jgi:hypothetical protein